MSRIAGTIARNLHLFCLMIYLVGFGTRGTQDFQSGDRSTAETQISKEAKEDITCFGLQMADMLFSRDQGVSTPRIHL